MHNQSIGLPGGPNEYITDISEFVSIEGYKSDSPDVSNPYNIINSSNITMEGVDFPVRGFGNNGIIQDMIPGKNYNYKDADYVVEVPMAQVGRENTDTSNQLVQTANRYVNEEKDTFRTIPLGKREKLLSYLGQSEFYSQNCVQTVKGMICDAEGAGGDEPTIPDDVYDNRTFKANHKEYGYSVVPTEERQPGDLLQYYYSYLEDDEKQWTDFPYHLGVYTGDDQYVSDGSGITGEGAAKKSIFFYDDAELEKKDLFTVYRKLPNKKMGGGLEPKQLDIYTKYISGENNTDEAKKTYDKLNRIYYKQSKDVGMSPANFIMTHVLGNS